jgi:hypothetical protein
LGQQASVEPRIPRLAGRLGDEQTGVTGGALERIFFASLAVLGVDGIIRANREALRRSRKSSNASFICGIVLRTSRKLVVSQFEIFGRLLCRKCSTAPSI